MNGKPGRDFSRSIFTVQEVEDATILEDVNFRIHSSPVKHLLPTIGLRFDLHKSGKSVAYSSDTEPSPALVRLASGVDVLIHEATVVRNWALFSRTGGTNCPPGRSSQSVLCALST